MLVRESRVYVKDEIKPELEKIIADSDREILQWRNTKLSLYE